MLYRTPRLITSAYDVMCNWSVNLFKRLELYPQSLRPRQILSTLQLLIPKFHLNAHIDWCRHFFSFNWSSGVGRTDAESPERAWAISNSLAGSTKKMGPGSRRDMLDEHFGDWNWRKTITLRMSIAFAFGTVLLILSNSILST